MPVVAVDIRTSLAAVLVHVAFTPGEQSPAPVGIVVDVLRATSTMTQALAAGYRRVLCCAEIEEARALAQTEGPAKLARRAPARGDRRLRLRQLAAGGRGRAGRGDARSSRRRTARACSSPPRSGSSTSTSARSSTSTRSRRRHARTSRMSPFSARACSASSRSTTRIARGGSRRCSAGTRPTPRRAAIRLARSFADAREGIGSGRSAWNLRRHGLEADIDWCARENALDVVPRYRGAVGPAANVGL